MSMASLEREILKELIEVTGNKKLKMKDVMEWSTVAVGAQGTEKLVFLPKLKIYCAIVEKP